MKTYNSAVNKQQQPLQVAVRLLIQPSLDRPCFSKLYKELYNLTLPKDSGYQEQLK
jgi:hypothetical protein